MAPLVSVVMLSYNHAPYLPAAIESVLGQTLQDLELVVGEDGSSDGSLEIARRYAEADSRVRVLTHPGHENRGIGATVNLVRSATSGSYQLGLPSDDMLYPDALERLVAYLEAHPEVGYVYGYAHMIDAEGRKLELQGRSGPEPRLFGRDLTADGRIVERLVQGNAIAAMTALWRRACLDQTGDEHPGLVYGDWEHQTRGAAHWEVAFIPRALARYRVHGANTSVDVARETKVRRQLEVTLVLRERAPSVGGRLAEPRVRAALELQVGYLRFAAGEKGGERDLRTAFERDPSLAADEPWLADWLWARPLDELLAGSGPEFAAWFWDAVRPLLTPRAARAMRLRVAASRAESYAIALSRAGHTMRGSLAAAAAVALSPGRLHDPGLRAVVLDSITASPRGAALRRAKRRVLRQSLR
jgi:hypothetical protein